MTLVSNGGVMRVQTKNSTAHQHKFCGNGNEDGHHAETIQFPAQTQSTNSFQHTTTFTLVGLTSNQTQLPPQYIAGQLYYHVTIELGKKSGRAFSVLTRAKALANDPLVKQIYEKSDYLRDIYDSTQDFRSQQELRDEVWGNRKKIWGVLSAKEELKIIGAALAFYPDTPWIKSLARHYAKITGITEPDATMQFAAYFTYPVAARPETKKALDAFMHLLESNS